MRARFSLRLSAATAALFCCGFAHAADIVILSGQTVTSQQNLSDYDTLTVEAGGEVEVTSDSGVSATGSGVTIKNAGKIWGLQSAVELGDGNTLYNSGTMSGGVDSGITVGSANTVTNSGTIDNDYGAVLVTGTGNEIENSGKITGGEAGLSVDAGSNTITNSGQIEGGISGIKFAKNNVGNTIVNSSLGEIDGVSNGIFLDATGNEVFNSGYIYGGDIGVYTDRNNTIANSGTIQSAYIGVNIIDDANTLANDGDIYGSGVGILIGGESNTVTNSGGIGGALLVGLVGIEVKGDDNAITNEATGKIYGDDSGVLISGSSNAFTNLGLVWGSEIAIEVANSNTVVNSGSVGGGISAVTLGSSNTFTNSTSGSLVSDGTGLIISGSDNVIANAGGITGSDAAVSVESDGNLITNSGDVTGGLNGIVVASSASGNTITNSSSGSIVGGTHTGIKLSGSGNQITNSGHIYGAAIGIDTLDGNTVENQGTIESDYVSVWMGTGSTLVNDGDINSSQGGVIVNGENSIIENNDTITAGEHGVVFLAANNALTNAGFVQGNTATGYAVYVNADSNLITNSATLDGYYGVGLIGDSNTVKNTGSVTGGSIGIDVQGDSNTIANAGTIEASGGYGYGILVEGSDNTVTNSGTIKGLEFGIDDDSISGTTITNSSSGQIIGTVYMGVALNGTGATLTNYGYIAGGDIGVDDHGGNVIVNHGEIEGASGIWLDVGSILMNYGQITGSTVGVVVTDGSASLVNEGTVSGVIAIDVDSNSSNNLITNSGTLSGTSYAVSFDSTGNSLALLNGSIIEGVLAMGTGNTVSFDKGMTAAMAYTGTPASTAYNDVIIATGSKLVTFDTTGFAAQDDQLNDLTRAIDDAIGQRQAATRQPAGGFQQVAGGLQLRPAADAPVDMTGTFWTSGFSAFQKQHADGANLGWNSLLGGGILGYDQAVRDDLRLGGLAGIGTSRFTSNGTEKVTATSYFAGAYTGYDFGGMFADAALFGGLSDFTQERDILDNTISGGTETVKTDHDGWFVNPSLTLGMPIAAGPGIATPSFRARYAAIFLEDYTEEWNAVDVSFDHRTVSLFDLRGQLAYALAMSLETGILGLALRGGLDVTFASADDVAVQAATASIDFATDGDGTSWRGFGGIDLAYTTDALTRFFVGGEAAVANGSDVGFTGRLGLDLHL